MIILYMSITNLIVILINLFFSSPLPLKKQITFDKRKISTTKFGLQDLIATHYDCSPRHITNMQCYKLKKIGECKAKPADFQILPIQVSILSQISTIQIQAFALYAKLSNKESLRHKIDYQRGYRFDHDKWYVNNIQKTEVETRRAVRELAL